MTDILQITDDVGSLGHVDLGSLALSGVWFVVIALMLAVLIK